MVFSLICCDFCFFVVVESILQMSYGHWLYVFKSKALQVHCKFCDHGVDGVGLLTSGLTVGRMGNKSVFHCGTSNVSIYRSFLLGCSFYSEKSPFLQYLAWAGNYLTFLVLE